MATESERPEQTAEELAAAKARYEALLESADPFVVAFRLLVRSWGAPTTIVLLGMALFFYDYLVGKTVAIVPALMIYVVVQDGQLGASMRPLSAVRGWDLSALRNAEPTIKRDWWSWAEIGPALPILLALVFFFDDARELSKSPLGYLILLVALSVITCIYVVLVSPRGTGRLDATATGATNLGELGRIGLSIWRLALVLVAASIALATPLWLVAFRQVEAYSFGPEEIAARLTGFAAAFLLIYACSLSGVLATRAHFRAVFGVERGRK